MFSQEKIFIKDSNKIHQEKIFIHLNSNFLLTGETLLYKLSCLNKLNNQYSKLSKIVYVEILNDKKERIVQQKIELKNGTAQGDFFIRNSLKSGNYKVIAYTKWMKNENFFTASDLNIINPYQTKIQKSADAITLKPNNYHVRSSTPENNSIVLNKKEYNKREKVSFMINLNEKNIASNNLSVSVRKIDNQFYSHKKNSLMFLQEKNKPGLSDDKITDIPDVRGDLIRGQVVSISNNKPIENIKVSLSIIQQKGFFLISSTDKNGYFSFILDNFRKTEKGYIQLIDANIKDYKITLTKESHLNFDHLSFKKLSTNKQLDSLIDKKSTYVQIENAYQNLKRDEIIIEKTTSTIPNSLFKKYKLDDFTRFKTIKETMKEVIPLAWSSTSKDNTTFQVIVGNSAYYNNILPLLLIDGFIVNDHNEFASVKMSLVDEVNISHNLFKFNSAIYKGIIAIWTYKGEYEPKTKELLGVNLKKPLVDKKYFFPNYSKTNNKQTPDFRTQLYWEPNLNISQKQISFYTSDVSGYFEIEIEGFSNTGVPISLRKNFIVN
jgi:hypothetical protein